MVHLKLIELVDSKFNSKVDFLGIKNFLSNINLESLTNSYISSNKENLSVTYYCFDVPNEFSEKFRSNEKIISEDLIVSSIYEIFSKKLFFEMNKIKPGYFKDYSEVKEKIELVSDTIDKYLTSSGEIKEERTLEDGRTITLDFELKSLSFYSGFFKEYRLNQARFLFSDFNIKYSAKVKDYVDMFRNELKGKEFDYQAFNRVIFEMYGFFKR